MALGAAAYSVIWDPDQGHIIEQVVEHVDHTQDPVTLPATDHDPECKALARAVKACIERRAFINAHRTIVL